MDSLKISKINRKRAENISIDIANKTGDREVVKLNISIIDIDKIKNPGLNIVDVNRTKDLSTKIIDKNRDRRVNNLCRNR